MKTEEKQKIVNIRDVARVAGVSRTTVSLVLNNSLVPAHETRVRVMNAAKELNYQPDPMFSQALRRRRAGHMNARVANRTIGFLTSNDLMIFEKAQNDDGYYSRVHAGLQRAIEEHHYHLMWKCADPASLTVPEMVTDNRVDGLLIEGNFHEVLRGLLATRLPVAFIDRSFPELEADSVMPNIERAVHEQLNYLWELGHRNIVTFSHLAVTLHTEVHLRVFHEFFARKNHPVLQPKLCEKRDINPQNHSRVMAEYAREFAAAQPRPTAFVSWDTYACPLLVELQRLGLRVPADVSVMGMDDIIAARLLSPQLSSYRFPMDELGRSATELLIARIEDRTSPVRHMVINGQIIERASCAKAASVL